MPPMTDEEIEKALDEVFSQAIERPFDRMLRRDQLRKMNEFARRRAAKEK